MVLFEKPACPECGSRDVVPIVYGLPGPETEMRALMGEVKLGGCIVYDNAPDLFCKSCGAEWMDRRLKRLLEELEGEDEGTQ